jgi:uncharacterized protein with FMN-binding domain
MKKWIIVLASVVIVIFIAVILIVNLIGGIDKKIENLSINNINLANIEDGDYIGKYSVFPVSVEVKVTVTDHQITDIVILKHENGQGKPAEVIIEDVKEKQSLDVPIISGATYSSKVILKAIEAALSNPSE